ncbi:MAG TPA: PilZ domain-containing protein [Bryobacteraceae bacterium]|jgi:hypothetical protein
MRLLDFLKQPPSPKKRAARYLNPGITAYYWDGGAPVGQPVKDISMAGAYLYTAERWYIGTIVTLTLERASEADGPASTISVPSRVVRHGVDGVGVSFMLRGKEEGKALERFVQTATAL